MGRGLRSIRLLSGLAIVAAVAGPWYLAVSFGTSGQWLVGFLGTHNAGRFMNAMEGHDGPIFYYLIAVLACLFPASCFLPVGVAGSVRARFNKEHTRSYYSHAFCLAYAGSWIGFFSLAATKLPNYIAPCYVGLAIGTAAWLVEQVRRFESMDASQMRSWLGAGMSSAVLAGLAITGTLTYLSVFLMGDAFWIATVGLIPALGGAAGLVFLMRRQARRAVFAYAGCAVLFSLFTMNYVVPAASPHADGPRIADYIRALEKSTGEKVEFATHHYTVPTLVWELRRTVPGLGDEATIAYLEQENAAVVMPIEFYERLKPRLPAGIGVVAEEHKFLRPEKRIVLVSDKRYVADLAKPSLR